MSDYPQPPIAHEHAWRDQLVPSPIEVVTNYRPEPSTQVNTHPVDTHVDDTHPVDTYPVDTHSFDMHSVDTYPVDTNAADEKPSSLPNHAHDSLPKPNELLLSSHLGQRLPPLKTIPTIKSVQTPNQLIQMLQHATHKLNELHGTHIKHCKVLRLYNLSELNDDSKSVATKVPTLSQLAESMDTTPKSLKKWYTIYQNAVMRDFNFEEFGEDRIKDHYGVFFELEERYQFSKCGERAMKEYFLEVGKRVGEGAQTDMKRKMSRIRRNRSSGAESNDLTHHYNIVNDTPGMKNDANDVASYNKHNLSRAIAGVNEDYLLIDHKNPFPYHFQINEARLLDLRSRNGEDASNKVSAIQLCSVAKRVKRGIKDRMLCMVVGCEKHAQTRCDGCCTAHFRLLSSTTGKDKEVSLASISVW